MIVLDTHVWLWWAAAPEKLPPTLRHRLGAEAALGVCTISCWEVAMLAERGRISVERGASVWIHQALAREQIRALPLTAKLAVDAALLPRDRLTGDPADRIIYATSRAEGALLATKDVTLRSFDPETTIWS